MHEIVSVCAENAEWPKEKSKKEKAISMTTKTKKIGRRLSRSMSIVALKIPEKAQIIARKTSTRVGKYGSDKKVRSFELSLIAPDKTQRQILVQTTQTVASVIAPILREFNIHLQSPRWAGVPTLPTRPSGAARLSLGGSGAPVEPAANATALEGEILVLDVLPPVWDGTDLTCFVEWERIYASTLYSSIELYGKPLLRAEIISKEEYHVLFYYLNAISEASSMLTERLQRYMEAGLLQNVVELELRQNGVQHEKETYKESILSELVQEGLLTQRDIDLADDNRSFFSSVICEVNDEVESKTTEATVPQIEIDTPDDTKIDDDFEYSVDVTSSYSRKCCSDHRISADICSNVWANVQWEFLGESKTTTSIKELTSDYDQVKVKRSQSDSRLTVQSEVEDGIYESLENLKVCMAPTPYESIEDLYECIKRNAQYPDDNENMDKNKDVTPTSETTNSSPIYQNLRIAREDSVNSGKDSCVSYESSTASYCKSYDTSSESTQQAFVGRCILSAEYFPDRRGSHGTTNQPETDQQKEYRILLNQLFSGDLMDVYNEFVNSYKHAKCLLRSKMKEDEHFSALVEIRKGCAKYTIADYLELPIERLAAYERLVGGRGDADGGRRAAQRLSDLERVQDLFPHDYLALHNADPHASAKSKTALRKRPSVDTLLGVAARSQFDVPATPTAPPAPRSFLMEAPAQLCAAPPAAPAQPLDRHLFLFTDLLIIAKGRGNNCFKLKESIRISEIWISPGGGDTGFLLGWPSSTSLHNHLVMYPTQAARDTWFRKIQTVLNTQLSLEPKSTNIQILYKDPTCSIEFCKTLAVTPEMTTNMVIKHALQLIQNNNEETQGEQDNWGPAKYFTLWTKTSRDSVAVALNGIERPHAIQMSRIRQTLSNEEGFDLQHVNSKNNPCGMVFELRKKLPTSIKSVRGGLKMLRSGRSEGSRLFGIPLERLCGADHRPPPTIMTLLRRLRMRAPHTEGVFRRSANAKALRVLRDKLDTLGGTCTRCPELETAPVLLLAALLKDFFRSLPQPLLLYSLYQNWINVLSLPPLEKVAAVRSLLLKLPKSHYHLLSYFICLLQAIAKNSARNLMCPMNLGVCVGPSILWPSTPCEKAPKAVPSLIELLIINADALFGPQVSRLLGNLETTNSMLDSGAEESDSVHSIGLSLDSLDLTCTRREKLSLSRDSGLMLSEDDSNSNGGNSPAPRNIQQLQTSSINHPQDMQKIYMQNYKIDGHNINGLPNTPLKNYAQQHKPENYGHYNLATNLQSNETNIYGNLGLHMSKCHYVTNNANIYAQRPRNNTNNTNLTHYKYNKDNQKSVCPDQTPAKYITGLEPEKPPRSNLSRAARTCKIYSMDTDVNVLNTSCTPRFARAKSSDDLLDRRQSTKYTSNQHGENIYSNQIEVSEVDIKDYNINKSESKENDCSSGLSYSRVYSEWDQRITKNYFNNNNQTNAQCSDNSFTQLNKETSNLMHTTNKQMQTATIFTRNDWTRQASRTKSLEGNAYDNIYNQDYMDGGSGDNDGNNGCNIGHLLSNKCMKRSIDPAHVCTLKCSSVTNGCVPENIYSIKAESSYISPLRSSHLETKENYDTVLESCSPSTTERGHVVPRKLAHSKSLANIVLHTDSSSNDTLYQPQGNNYNCSMPNSSASSETSYSNKCSVEYPEPTYVSSTSEHSDTFCENIYGNTGACDPIYSSDIYTAKLVQPEYHMKIYQQGPPPVPPRKGSHQNGLKKFPPVHITKETKKTRSKSVPPVYRGPPEHCKRDDCKSDNKKEQNLSSQQTSYVLDLNCSDTDTESESYV